MQHVLILMGSIDAHTGLTVCVLTVGRFRGSPDKKCLETFSYLQCPLSLEGKKKHIQGPGLE